jgi:hypothetical protein
MMRKSVCYNYNSNLGAGCGKELREECEEENSV